jgi:hypothetical protein
VGRAAKALGTAAAVRRAAAGRERVGQSSLQAARARAWGAPPARASARRLVLEAVARWARWRAQPPRLWAQAPPMQEGRETRGQRVAQATEPALAGGPGARRLKQHVAPDRRLAREDADRRHGRTSRSTPCHGFTEPVARALDSTVTREVVVGPATHPAPEAVELLAEALEHGAGRFPLASALGDMASPRLAPGAAQGGHRSARPWPPGRAAVSPAGLHAGLPARPGPLAQRPDRAAGPRPGRPGSGPGL